MFILNGSSDRAINLNITTYEFLAGRGDRLIKLFDFVLAQISPFLHEELIISTQKRSLRYVNYELDDKGLKNFYSSLKKGENLSVHILDRSRVLPPKNKRRLEEKNSYIPDVSIGLSCFDAEKYPEEALQRLNLFNVFTLGLHERLFEGQIPLRVQDAMKGIFLKAITLLNGITGYMTYDTTFATFLNSDQSPFEKYYGINVIASPRLSEGLKGYFWLTYLTEGHLRSLGGEEFVSENHPCLSIASLSTESHTGFILQLTEDINDYEDKALLELRKFLLPTLHFGENENRNLWFAAGSGRLVEHLVV